MRLRKGDVCLANLASGFGHEQSGIRPVIILAATSTKIVVIIPITSNRDALRFPHTLALKATGQNGLMRDSVALLFHIRAIDERRIEEICGHLEVDVLKEIDDSLREFLAL